MRSIIRPEPLWRSTRIYVSCNRMWRLGTFSAQGLYCGVCACVALTGAAQAQPALAQPTQAQPAQNKKKPSKPLSGKVSAGYLATSGNTQSTNANVNMSLLYEPDSWSHQFDLHAVTAASQNVTTAESYSAAYETKRTLGPHSYAFVSAEWDRDRFSSYARRLSEAGGYGWRLIGTDRQTLDLEAGGGARQARRVDGLKEDEAILRGSVTYRLAVNGTTSFQQALTFTSGSSNTYTEAVSELDAKLFGAVSLVLSYRLKHNSTVLPGTMKTDRFTAISLEYSF